MRLRVADCALVVERVVEQGAVTVVRGLQEHARTAVGIERVECVGDRRRKLVVVHEHGGIGIVEQVREFRADIAVVHVDRNGPELLRRVERFHVGGRVDAHDRDFVVGLNVVGGEHRSEARGPVVELGVCEMPVAADERNAVGREIGDSAPGPGEGVVGHGPAGYPYPSNTPPTVGRKRCA